MTKKVISLLFAIVLCASSCFISASAEALNVDTKIDEPIVYRYGYTDTAGATIRQISSTCVQCSSDYLVFDPGYQIRLFCNLQMLYAGAWTEHMTYYKDFNSSVDWENGTSRIYTGLDEGESYRTHTIVEVRNASGTLLEVVNVYSTSILL